ncbi:MAG: amidohydrolase family protein [Bacteroidota bacterium]
MKKIQLIVLLLLPIGLFAQIAIKAEIIYTVSSSPIRDGVILIKDGKIKAVGTAAEIKIPEEYKIYPSKIVTPGLIDARSVIGMSGAMNVAADQDQLEKSSPIQPELRAIDAYNPNEQLVRAVREFGVTTMHTGHGIGALVSGQTMIVKTKKGTVETVVINPFAMLAMTIGPEVSDNFSSPGTKAKQISMIRTELFKAQDYLKKMSDKDSTKRPTFDLKMDALSKMLKGEIKALITANKSVDIMNAIRLAKEFNLKLVIDGAAEAYLLINEIKASKAEVILHATMARNDDDMINMNRESAMLLTKAGINVSIESGYESYVPKSRVILFEAAEAVAYGLSFDEGLKAVTINPAKLLGIDNRVGSIEKGKDADLVLYNGDPFEYTTNVTSVIIDGVVEYNTAP